MTTPYSPVFLQPNLGGMLSNDRGRNFSSDAIVVQARYSNPDGTQSPPGSFRSYISRIPAGGTLPDYPWDSWWVSAGNINNSLGLVTSDSPNCSAVYNNRLYVYGSNAGYGPTSAPINGSSLGTWRRENGVAIVSFNGIPTIAHAESIVILNGIMYATIPGPQTPGVPTRIWYSPIAGDGTLGTWSLLSTSGFPVFNGSAYVTGYSDTTGSYLLLVTPSNNTYYNLLNSDGTVSGSWTQATNTPASNVFSAGYFCQSSGNNDGLATLYIIGGSTAASPGVPVATIQKSSLTAGNTGAFTSLATGLPAARANFGFAVYGPDASNDYELVVMGGNNTFATNQVTPGFHASGQNNTCWFIKASQLGAAWGVAGTLATAVDAPFAAFVGNKAGATWTVADVFVGAGWDGVTTPTTVQHSHWTGSKPNFSTSSLGNTLQASDLGLGASIVNNLDGTVDVTYNMPFTAIPSPQLVDGDIVTLYVQFTDDNGDPSPVENIQIIIGQPPVVGNVSPGGILSLVTQSFTFNFLTGAGGGREKSWRLQIIQGPATNIVYDTGVIRGRANSQALASLPAFASGIYALYITVVSMDNVYPGSSNQNIFASSVQLNISPGSIPN